MADRLLPATKQQGTKVITATFTLDDFNDLNDNASSMIIMVMMMDTKQQGTKVPVLTLVTKILKNKVNYCLTLKVIVLDDTWWADPRLGDLSEPLPPPLVEVLKTFHIDNF